MVGQHLHLGVLVVARAEPEHRQVHALPAALVHEVMQLVLRGHAHVQVAVGGHDDAVRAAFDEVPLGHVVGCAQAGLAVRGALGPQAAHCAQDALPVGAARAFQHHALLAAVRDQGHAVVLAQALHERGERLLQKRKLVGVGHGAGHVDEEHEVRAGLGSRLGRSGGETHDQELRVGVPWAVGHLGRDAEQVVALGRCVAVIEVVQQLLGAHGACGDVGGPRPVAHHAAQVGIGGRVHIGGERGERPCGRGHEAGLLHACVPLAGIGVRRQVAVGPGRAAGGCASRVHAGRARGFRCGSVPGCTDGVELFAWRRLEAGRERAPPPGACRQHRRKREGSCGEQAGMRVARDGGAVLVRAGGHRGFHGHSFSRLLPLTRSRMPVCRGDSARWAAPLGGAWRGPSRLRPLRAVPVCGIPRYAASSAQ